MLNINPRYLQWFLRSLPNIFWPIKHFIIKASLKSVGTNFRFGNDSNFNDHRLIEIGNNVFFGQRTTINCIVPVIIGNKVMFGPEVVIMGGDHNFSEPGLPMRDVKNGGINLPIVIEDDVWIGARTIILKGVSIGEGSVIGAGSIITRSTLPYSINFGQPSKFIKCRFNEEELKYHLKTVGSKYNIDSIRELYSESNLTIRES